MISLSISIVLYQPDIQVFISVIESLNIATAKLVVEMKADVKLIVLDNSVDTSFAEVKKKLEKLWDYQFRVIQASENYGYAKGHNIAIKESCSDYHLILNPDVIVDENALIFATNYLMNNKQAVLVSPYACSEDGSRQYLCKAYPSVVDLLLRGFAPQCIRRLFAKRLEQYELRGKTEFKELDDVLIVSGCFMFVRKNSFDAVGGFTESFFLYFEDFDLSLKLKEIGRLAYVPEVKIIHFGGRAAKKGVNHIIMFGQSMVSFFYKHGWRWF